MLTLRLVFRLPLRQTGAFLDSLLSWMGLDLKAPDHGTLSRRNRIVEVQPLTRAHDGPIDLIVDSTGLKILGAGEWNVHKHKASKRGRAWRKLHIGVDEEGFIVAAALGPGSVDDASTVVVKHGPRVGTPPLIATPSVRCAPTPSLETVRSRGVRVGAGSPDLCPCCRP